MIEQSTSMQMQSPCCENGNREATGGNVGKPCEADRTAIIRKLNDILRQSFVGGMVMITRGTDALSDDTKLAVMKAVQSFDDFNPNNDPYGEHDFGSFDLKGDKFFWKIDCYDLDMLGRSPDATDPKITRRVLTIMKAEEY